MDLFIYFCDIYKLNINTFLKRIILHKIFSNLVIYLFYVPEIRINQVIGK